MAVPSLANEKADRVQMRSPIVRAVVFMLVIYVAMGLLGDAAFADENSDILATILNPELDPDDRSSGQTPVIAKFAVFAFSHAIVPCIPLYCVLIGYNLREGFGMASVPAYLLSNVVPWFIALLLTYQPFFSALVGWSSLFVSGWVAVAPSLGPTVPGRHTSRRHASDDCRRTAHCRRRSVGSASQVRQLHDSAAGGAQGSLLPPRPGEGQGSHRHVPASAVGLCAVGDVAVMLLVLRPQRQ